MSRKCLLLVIVGFAVALALSMSLRGSLHAPGNAGAGAQRPDAPARVEGSAPSAENAP